jgi:SAM-dependent methyltransferase
MSTINNQVEYWNRVAFEKKFQHPLKWEIFDKVVTRESFILDYGCGYGRTCKDLWEHGFQNVIGIDSSHRIIDRGHNENPHLDLRILNTENLPFVDDFFDAVLLFTLLTCIPTNEGQKAIVQETLRVLRPGGLLYISDLLIQSDERNRLRYQKYVNEFGVYGVFRLPEGVVCRHHDKDWIETLTSRFERIELLEIEVVTMNGHPAQAFQYFGRKYE